MRAACIAGSVGVPGLPPVAQGRGGAVRPGSRGRLELGQHAFLSGPGPLSRAAPASEASGPEFQEGLVEATELLLFCC